MSHQQYPPPQQWKVIKTGGARHKFHFMMTLFTCGLWSPIWLLAWMFAKKHKVAVPK